VSDARAAVKRPARALREAARIARDLAKTVRLHREPDEAARFEQIAAEGESRARHLEQLERLHRMATTARRAWRGKCRRTHAPATVRAPHPDCAERVSEKPLGEAR
jgi:hypothetical protein